MPEDFACGKWTENTASIPPFFGVTDEAYANHPHERKGGVCPFWVYVPHSLLKIGLTGTHICYIIGLKSI